MTALSRRSLCIVPLQLRCYPIVIVFVPSVTGRRAPCEKQVVYSAPSRPKQNPKRRRNASNELKTKSHHLTGFFAILDMEPVDLRIRGLLDTLVLPSTRSPAR
jgi:hypothetical protein